MLHNSMETIQNCAFLKTVTLSVCMIIYIGAHYDARFDSVSSSSQASTHHLRFYCLWLRYFVGMGREYLPLKQIMKCSTSSQNYGILFYDWALWSVWHIIWWTQKLLAYKSGVVFRTIKKTKTFWKSLR